MDSFFPGPDLEVREDRMVDRCHTDLPVTRFYMSPHSQQTA